MNRKRNIYRIIAGAICLLLIHNVLSAQNEREYIRKGNKLYKKNEYAGSEGLYRKALDQDKPAEDAGFNLGAALYKQGRFGEAAKEYGSDALSARSDTLKQAEGFYNLGNSLLKDQKYEESIKAYINSLILNPSNMQAKYNLAYAQDQLKKQEQQQQQQDQQNQDQKQQDQKQDQQPNNKKDNEKKEDQQDKDNKDQNGEQQQQDQQNQQEKQQQQPSISREDAKRLLDALAANEKDTQEKVQRDRAAAVKMRVIKNW
jgi:Ca-activated chloride channel family protein